MSALDQYDGHGKINAKKSKIMRAPGKTVEGAKQMEAVTWNEEKEEKVTACRYLGTLFSFFLKRDLEVTNRVKKTAQIGILPNK